MRRILTTLVLTFSAGLPVAAQDAGRGAALFGQCVACHSVVTPDGTVLRGGSRVGPNLYGVAGRRAGGDPGFDYSPWLREAGRTGLTWTPETFAAYLRNPTAFTKDWLGDDSARARMAFRLESGAGDILAYLRSLER
ncbi:cytochrome C [Roseivivax marinus]|uniref:c-type cytochrome n=1 Tax=Roseivivax marinus TaxID=1379903 RepID=UPI001F03990F|nr:cytochrome C [Roseivivax marinus]UMA64309.1 cytochrome C [Roseivivax marinus]